MATTDNGIVYDVCTIFTHADGTEGYKPLMLSPNEWEDLKADGLTSNLRYGFTRQEADLAARLSLPLLRHTFADFIAAGGQIDNRVEQFFG